MFERTYYKERVRKLQRQHFTDVADAETKIHDLGKELLEQVTKDEIERKKFEDEKNREIMNLKHALKLREDQQKLDLEKLRLEHREELDKARADFKDEKYDEMKVLLERETTMQRNIMNILVQKLPENIGIKTIQEGSPVLRIEDVKTRKGKETPSKG